MDARTDRRGYETPFALPGNEGERELRIFSNLLEVSPEALETFSLRNYKRLQEAFLIFIE